VFGRRILPLEDETQGAICGEHGAGQADSERRDVTGSARAGLAEEHLRSVKQLGTHLQSQGTTTGIGVPLTD